MRAHLATAWMLAALCPIGAAVAQTDASPSATARSAVVREARAFQRDLASRNWNALLDHFWPAKVTARWESPFDSDLKVEFRPPARARNSATTVQRPCGEIEPIVETAGRWARVVLPECGSPAAELWMFEMNGRWKIVRLELETHRAWVSSGAPQ